MKEELADRFRPVAPPRILEQAYTEDQHARLLGVVRDHGPWPMILAHHFKTPEEVVATSSGEVPEGVTLTWDAFLNPVFRGYLARGSVCLFPEIEDCYHNPDFLAKVRDYYGAAYAHPESMLFNISGPCGGGGSPHVDGTRFRGLNLDTSPVWLLNIMAKSGLFKQWQAKKAQVIAWYYKGRIGGSFTYWPDGPRNPPQQLKAPMWGKAVVVENEMMYHTAEMNGPSAMRRPEGLAYESTIRSAGRDWEITTGDRVIQTIPDVEMRFLVHWGAQLYMNYEELKVSLDHTDDLTIDRAFDILIADLRARGETFEMPTDPITDRAFIRLLTRVYDLGKPQIFPPDPVEDVLAA
jgi:hypothetical protein